MSGRCGPTRAASCEARSIGRRLQPLISQMRSEPEQHERHDDGELLGAFLEQAVDELVRIMIAAADEHGRALRAAGRDDGAAARRRRR